MTAHEPVLLDTILRPNPPMTEFGLRLALTLVAAVNLVFSLMFVLRGAWPVMPFLGLDVALLAWAFRASVRQSRRSERVTLTPSSLVVERRTPDGAPSTVTLNPYWVRVDMDEPPEHWSQLTLWSHGKGVRLGTFAAPAERQTLAQALKSALRRARETLPLRD